MKIERGQGRETVGEGIGPILRMCGNLIPPGLSETANPGWGIQLVTFSRVKVAWYT